MDTTRANPLKTLAVIDRLEVGPVRLEPRRLIARYTVHQNGAADSFDFSYCYEEDVFDPDQGASQNLASMMAAQVALNYGLFCDQIVFQGPLDEADRKFLADMAENTAREIFVKKFLEPNPFLIGSAARVPTIKTNSFLQAKLVFPELCRQVAAGQPTGWMPAATPCAAVLSSGGKESLLSYSLLREMSVQTHSIFVNESGRHWFTALNAYRHFAANCPHTTRVWTNSDRLFAWMLRRLPFIRPDFAQVRSDEYPIRLWTVAVFVFGALPLLRKHNVGRLVIGDEFDTTDPRTRHGIPHYNGLFDQSRYFDDYLTDYFDQKRWNVEQFSLLRSLSELLVEKVLVERYPEMQQLQTSCHAAHIQGDRVRPCGKCEKCARVVTMLAALGADPCRCGYTPEQVQRCLEQLGHRGLMLEDDALKQLHFLLQERSMLSTNSAARGPGRERKQIMQLRFDPQRSPADDVPMDLRRPLYTILLQHANGAVRRCGDTWIEFDPLGARVQRDSSRQANC